MYHHHFDEHIKSNQIQPLRNCFSTRRLIELHLCANDKMVVISRISEAEVHKSTLSTPRWTSLNKIKQESIMEYVVLIKMERVLRYTTSWQNRRILGYCRRSYRSEREERKREIIRLPIVDDIFANWSL